MNKYVKKEITPWRKKELDIYDKGYIIYIEITPQGKLEVIHMMRLKQALDTKGISQKSCAELLGVTEKTLYNKMTGRTEFTYGEVRRLKAFLPEFSMDYLLTMDDKREVTP